MVRVLAGEPYQMPSSKQIGQLVDTLTRDRLEGEIPGLPDKELALFVQKLTSQCGRVLFGCRFGRFAQLRAPYVLSESRDNSGIEAHQPLLREGRLTLSLNEK